MNISYNNGSETKMIGSVNHDTKVYSKRVKESKHLFRVLDAWGVSADVLNTLPGYTIQVYDSENKVLYRTTVENFKEKGQYYHFKGSGRDHGTQMFLKREYWDRVQR